MVSVILPALRAAIAQELSAKYNYRQAEIARRLGVVQVAVSKYINYRYSGRVGAVKEYIVSRKMHSAVVDAILNNADKDNINLKIEGVCTDSQVLKFIMVV
jgi:predicted transcriptional regulator